MNREQLMAQFENMTPGEAQKARIRDQLQARMESGARPAMPSKRRKRTWLAIPAACLALVLAFILIEPFGDETSAYAIDVKVGKDGALFRLAGNEQTPEDYGTSVSNVDARPGLEFYIDGDDIAKIEIESDNEYLYAVDWTKTQHEKYWNVEYYQSFDEERQVATANFDLLYDKKMTMTFDENFSDYDKIWYRWTAWNMYKWAAADNYAHFLGAGLVPKAEEELEFAAGNDGSGIGHIQLDGYPEELTEDNIRITITDRQGNVTTKVIHVQVSNNDLRQTVVTASLEK